MGLERFSSEEIARCLGGVRPEAAIRHILDRKAEREIGQSSRSSRKTACILQGGAMRGVVSAGSVIAMETLGFTEGFDAVYGASAGAINGAYFLARQSAFGTSIYYQDIANRRFINPLRLSKIADMDFLFDQIITKKKRLDVPRIRRNRTPLYIAATDVETARETVFCSHDDAVDLLAALKASAAMPILYHRPVTVNGRRYFDGGVVDSIPIERAINDGCTDLLVVFTVPKDFRATPPGLVERWLAARLLRPLSRELEIAFHHRQDSYNRALDIALGKVRLEAEVNIVAVFPDPDLRLSRLTKNARTLKRAAIECGHRVMRLFSEKDHRRAELIQFIED
jgi:predicted patatin/cPLA2 family phospholipase